MATKRLKRPRDPVQLAKLIGDIATGRVEDRKDTGGTLTASEVGRLGGLKGGHARAAKLSPEQRAEAAKAAARARWGKARSTEQSQAGASGASRKRSPAP